MCWKLGDGGEEMEYLLGQRSIEKISCSVSINRLRKQLIFLFEK